MPGVSAPARVPPLRREPRGHHLGPPRSLRPAAAGPPRRLGGGGCGRGLGGVVGPGRRGRRPPRPLLGDAGMFTLLTAESARGGAGASGGWAAASLTLGTRLAVRRVGGRACTVRGGGAARGGDRLRASQPQSPAQRAFPQRLLARPPARPGPLAGRRTDNSQLPGESLRGCGAGPSGDPAGAGRGWGCVGIARAASGSRGRGGGAGRGAPRWSPRLRPWSWAVAGASRLAPALAAPATVTKKLRGHGAGCNRS